MEVLNGSGFYDSSYVNCLRITRRFCFFGFVNEPVMKKRSFIYVVSLGSRQFVVHTGVGHVKLAFNDIS